MALETLHVVTPSRPPGSLSPCPFSNPGFSHASLLAIPRAFISMPLCFLFSLISFWDGYPFVSIIKCYLSLQVLLKCHSTVKPFLMPAHNYCPLSILFSPLLILPFHSALLVISSLQLNFKVLEDRNYVLIMLCPPKCLSQCLPHSKHSITAGWMNECYFEDHRMCSIRTLPP